MTGIMNATRDTLEHFASRLISEHRSRHDGTCGSCHQWAPCPVERAAIEHDLAAPPPTYFETWGTDWHITVTDTTVVCETGWREYGRGRVITFDRQAVESGDQGTAGPWDPTTRAAWSHARLHLLEKQRDK